MKNKQILLIVIVFVVILILGAVFLKVKGNPLRQENSLTREQMQAILLKGNKYAGADIEAMTDQQLLTAIQAGGYVLTV